MQYLWTVVLEIFSLKIFSSLLVFDCGGISGKELTCQWRRRKRRGFNPWVGKIPCRREWQPTLVFLPVESHGQRGAWQATVHRVTKSRTQLSSYHTLLKWISAQWSVTSQFELIWVAG